MGASHRRLRGLGSAAHHPVHLAGEEGADRSAGRVLDHPVLLRPAEARVARTGLADVGAGLGRCGSGHDQQGCWRGRIADAAACGIRIVAWLAGCAVACPRSEVLAGATGVPRRLRGVAGADAAGRARQRRAGVPRLRRRHPAAADRDPLCEGLAPRPAALVFPRGRADRLAADHARLAVGAPGLAATPATSRSALPVAAGLGVAGVRVLQHPVRQARHVHPAGAADAVPGAGAAAAGHPAQAECTTPAGRLRRGVLASPAGRGTGDAVRRTRLRAQVHGWPGCHRRAWPRRDVRRHRGRGHRRLAVGRPSSRTCRADRDVHHAVGAVFAGGCAAAKRWIVVARVDAQRRHDHRSGCATRPGRLARTAIADGGSAGRGFRLQARSKAAVRRCAGLAATGIIVDTLVAGRRQWAPGMRG